MSNMNSCLINCETKSLIYYLAGTLWWYHVVHSQPLISVGLAFPSKTLFHISHDHCSSMILFHFGHGHSWPCSLYRSCSSFQFKTKGKTLANLSKTLLMTSWRSVRASSTVSCYPSWTNTFLNSTIIVSTKNEYLGSGVCLAPTSPSL